MAMADLIGTAIVAGILILMMIGLTASVSESTTQQMLDVTTQQALTTITGIVEYDFHKMGFEMAPGAAITAMDVDSITFWAGIDTDSDGVIDGVNTITYQMSDTSQASSTPNPDDRILYRTVGAATPAPVALGLTNFELEYFDIAGSVTANPADVRTIKINLTMQSTISFDNAYSEAAWEKKICPRNL